MGTSFRGGRVQIQRQPLGAAEVFERLPRHRDLEIDAAALQRLLCEHCACGEEPRARPPLFRLEDDVPMHDLRPEELADRIDQQLRALAGLRGQPYTPYVAELAGLDARRLADQVR